jgi:hypothetical protein
VRLDVLPDVRVAIARQTLTVIVPHHREIAAGTLRSILLQAGLTVAEFERLAP